MANATYDLTKIERRVWSQSGLVAGFDEAGCGSLAGPVVAACVIVDPEKVHLLNEVYDSKKVSFKKRYRLRKLIQDCVVSYGEAFVSAKVIDKINIFQASLQAMETAFSMIPEDVDVVRLLIDGKHRNLAINIPQECIVKGDSKSLSIAAASILAKTARDSFMMGTAHELYPDYGFDHHKGYGSKAHIAAIEKHGPCPIHRRTFAPIKHMEI